MDYALTPPPRPRPMVCVCVGNGTPWRLTLAGSAGSELVGQGLPPSCRCLPWYLKREAEGERVSEGGRVKTTPPPRRASARNFPSDDLFFVRLSLRRPYLRPLSPVDGREWTRGHGEGREKQPRGWMDEWRSVKGRAGSFHSSLFALADQWWGCGSTQGDLSARSWRWV